MRLPSRLQTYHWVFCFATAFCLAANLLPYADMGFFGPFSLPLGSCNDCIYYLGRPFAFYEEGGESWRRKYYVSALGADVAIAAAVILAITFGFKYRRELAVAIKRLSVEVQTAVVEFRKKLH